MEETRQAVKRLRTTLESLEQFSEFDLSYLSSKYKNQELERLASEYETFRAEIADAKPRFYAAMKRLCDLAFGPLELTDEELVTRIEWLCGDRHPSDLDEHLNNLADVIETNKLTDFSDDQIKRLLDANPRRFHHVLPAFRQQRLIALSQVNMKDPWFEKTVKKMKITPRAYYVVGISIMTTL